MEKLIFKKVDEVVYHEKLDSGVNVYLYPQNNKGSINNGFNND